MSFRTSKKELEDELLNLDIQRDVLRHRIHMRTAEENVRATGLTNKDEDFWFEVERETDRLLDEDLEWERRRDEERYYDDLRREEEEKFFQKHAEEK